MAPNRAGNSYRNQAALPPAWQLQIDTSISCVRTVKLYRDNNNCHG